MKIEICKIEAPWLRSGLGCYVSLNNSLIDVITPLNNTHEPTYIDAPEKGTLRLVIRDMGKHDGNIALSSINLENILNTLQWIDLQPACESSPGGKILIKAFRDQFNDEIFLIQSEDLPEDTSDYVLASEILTSNEPYSDLLKTSHFRVEEPDKKFEEIIDLLNGEIESYKESLQMERQSNLKLREMVQGFINSQETQEKRSKERESSLIELLNEKELELRKVIDCNRETLIRLKASEIESLGLKSRLQKEVEENRLMKAEIENYKKSLKEFEENNKKLSSALLEVTASQIELNEKNAEIRVEKDDFQILQKNLAQTEGKNAKLEDFVYQVDDQLVHLVSTPEVMYVETGQKVVDSALFFKTPIKKPVRNSDVPIINYTFDSPEKKPKNPSKTILKPLNMVEKQRFLVFKPILKKT